MTAPAWLTVLDDTITACHLQRRPDLAHGLHRTRGRLLAPRLRVLVLGLVNQGKSQLINALVNAPVCPVGDDVTTSAPTVVQHAESPSASLVTDPGDKRALSVPTERVEVSIDEVSRQVSGRSSGRGDHVVRAEIGIPRKLLATGLVLIDTPPVGGTRAPDAAGTTRTLAAAEQADTVLFATAATAELSATELDLLGRISVACPNIVVVLTKIDLVPRWRQVAEHNLALLTEARVPARQLPVSAALRLAAAERGDTAINAESGFPDLIAFLRRQVTAKADEVAPTAVGVACGQAIGALAADVRTALVTPPVTRTPDVEAQLALAQRAMDELHRRTSRCQTVLADQITDLVGDVEHDLRDRTRRILREVDRVFDEADPRTIWESFDDWLRDNLTEAAEVNLGWLVERCQWVADQVVAIFPAGTTEPPADALLTGAGFPVDAMGELDVPRLDRFGAGQKIFTGLRGSYGGVIMFGLITSMAGLPLINAISLGAGAAFGGKTIKDEADARLKRRQVAAKAAAQRYVDDFFLAWGKESKDLVRQVHRVLRDHVTDRAQELSDRITASSIEARRTAQAAAGEREQRRQRLTARLEELVALHRRAMALAVHRPVDQRPQGLELSA